MIYHGNYRCYLYLDDCNRTWDTMTFDKPQLVAECSMLFHSLQCLMRCTFPMSISARRHMGLLQRLGLASHWISVWCFENLEDLNIKRLTVTIQRSLSKAKQIKRIQIGTRIFALDARCLGFGEHEGEADYFRGEMQFQGREIDKKRHCETVKSSEIFVCRLGHTALPVCA